MTESGSLTRLTTTQKIVSATMLFILLLSAGVQYNDPDPWLWIAVYLAGALLTAAHLFGRGIFMLNLLAAGLGILGVILIVLPLDDVATERVFASIQMQGEGVEEVREAGGLAMQSVWLLYLAWSGRPAAPAAP